LLPQSNNLAGFAIQTAVLCLIWVYTWDSSLL